MLDKVIIDLAEQLDSGLTLRTDDAARLELEMRRFAIEQIPNTLSESRFEGAGTAPAMSVPLTSAGIAAAVARARDAEDAQAKRTAAIWGVAASVAIGAGVMFLTSGALSPAVATSIVGATRDLFSG